MAKTTKKQQSGVAVSIAAKAVVQALKLFGRFDSKVTFLRVHLGPTEVVFEADDGSIRLRRTVPCSGEGVTPWSGSVNLKTFATTLNALKDTVQLVIETEKTGSKLCIVQDGKNFSLTADEAEPVKFLDTEGVQISAGILRRGFAKTMDFVGDGDLRPAMGGIKLQTVEGKLRFIATDGHVLSWYEALCDLGEATIDGIVPVEVASMVRNLSCESFVLSIQNNVIGVTFDDGKLEGALIEEQYPNAKAIIDQAVSANTSVAVISRGILEGVLRTSSVYAAPDSTVMFILGENGGKVLTADVDFGAYMRERFAISGSGLQVQIATMVNWKYVKLLLDTVDTDDVVVKFNPTGSDKAIIMTPSQQVDESHTLVVMPVRMLGAGVFSIPELKDDLVGIGPNKKVAAGAAA